MSEEQAGEPTWMYRLKDGKVESGLFDSLRIPKEEGWVDTPARCTEAPTEEPKPKRRGRPRKVSNGDG